MRTGGTLVELDAAPWVGTWGASPANLWEAPGPLDPNPTNFIEVLFELETTSDAKPKLKSFQILYECSGVVPK